MLSTLEKISNFRLEKKRKFTIHVRLHGVVGFFVFGGNTQKTQISIINGCRLERVDSLDFDQTYGGCTNVNDQSIYLCFNYASADYKKCRVTNDPFGTFEEIEETVYNHKQTLIGASRGKI